jgi:putative DNA primase/helicase
VTAQADRLVHAEQIFGVDTRDDVLTEAGAAERFVRRHGDDLRFDHRRQRMLLWSGTRWIPDADAEVTRRAHDFARDWQREAVEILDRDRREAVLKFAIRLERRDAIQSMLWWARALRPIADTGDGWDGDPWLLGVLNGVVDLRTGLLRPGRRADRITMSAGVAFDPAATCPRFERFILEIAAGDPDLAAYFQRTAGMDLTGDVSEQIVRMWIGRGSNGKSTLLRALLQVWGDYADVAAFATFERSSQRSSIPNDLAALVGKRLVWASEAREGARLDEGRLKSITGGDRLRARFLNAEWFSFDPACKLVLSLNHRPVVSDDSFGFWRRVRLVPFDQTFAPDPALEGQLRDEAPGILAWAVRGCLAWQRDGLGHPARVLQATADYQADSDPLRAFIEEACEPDPGAEVVASELYDHYKGWAERQGLGERERLSATMFGRRMAERYTRRKTRSGAVYEGIARTGVTGFPQ